MEASHPGVITNPNNEIWKPPSLPLAMAEQTREHKLPKYCFASLSIASDAEFLGVCTMLRKSWAAAGWASASKAFAYTKATAAWNNLMALSLSKSNSQLPGSCNSTKLTNDA